MEYDGHVAILNEENFNREVAKMPNVLIKLYAPWCGHCKKLAPEFEKAAEILSKNDPPIVLAKIDATTERRLAHHFKI